MFFPIILISVFYVIGFGLLGYGILSSHRSLQAGNWPTVEGAVTKVELVETNNDGTTYEVKPEYTYQVGGTQYQGSRVAFGYSGSSEREAHQEIYEKIKNATSVMVRYDPANPANATLSYGFHLSLKMVLAFAITWLGFVIGFSVLWLLASQSDTTLLQNLCVK
jgi:hypothetical protein